MHENCEFIHLFPPLICKFIYDFDYQSINPRIIELFRLVQENSKLEAGDALSTVSIPERLQPHTWIEFKDFQTKLGLILDEVKKEYKFVDKRSVVKQSWINRHGIDGETLEHSHSATTFAVAAYLKCPPNSGNIVFRDPLEYHKHSFPIYPEESNFKEVPVKTNDVLIFPGWLKHHVKPNKSQEERLVLTLNIQ